MLAILALIRTRKAILLLLLLGSYLKYSTFSLYSLYIRSLYNATSSITRDVVLASSRLYSSINRYISYSLLFYLFL